ncbi:MAG TPA: cupin domain-containing protein [Streptosporangiaceae bacterium]|nr:cupin domain-containing protein [Streptosporangiaceae bacterium]
MRRPTLDTGAQGQQTLSRQPVEVPPGRWCEGTAGPGGELWFVIAGAGRLESPAIDDTPIRRDTGLWLPPGVDYRIHSGGPDALRLDRVTLPAGVIGQAGTGGPVPRVSELSECAMEVTGNRRFRVLFGPGNGCEAATQFVGEIPPGRAPDHTHTYDELVLVLEGEGIAHTGEGDHPLAPGATLHLRPGQVHCLENTGQATLRVLGVFHPGGSPAAKKERPGRGQRSA